MHPSPRLTAHLPRLARPRTAVAGLFLVGLVAAGAPAAPPPQPAAATASVEPVRTHGDIESGDEAHFHEEDAPAPVTPAVDLAAGRNEIDPDSPWAGRWGPEIEPLAAYDPQRTCIPGARPAVAAFAALLAEAHPHSRNLGITRGCDIGSRSEHKEGRAYDWGVRVSDPDEAEAAQQLLAWLLASDEHGNAFAMARRLGVMYIIWDDHIWSSSAAEDGWRVYTGPNPHTDHVHVSFDWAGAMGATSFWEGSGLEVGPWLTGGFSLEDFPAGFELGGDTYRTELGPTPGSEARWSGSSTGEAGPDGGADDGDATEPSSASETSAEEPAPDLAARSADEPTSVATVPPLLLGPALPWPLLPAPDTATTTTSLPPVEEMSEDLLEDAESLID